MSSGETWCKRIHQSSVDLGKLSLMRRPKDPLQTLKQTGVVYAIPCKDCDVEYIWETGRALETQKNEHRHYYRCVYDMQKRNNSAASKSCTGGGQKKVAIHENMIILV